jgi:CRISPR-associated protein (TIGR03984 family)
MSDEYVQSVEQITLPDTKETSQWGKWLAEQTEMYALPDEKMTLLVHADDGVIWGQLSGDALTLSGHAYDVVNVSLRAKTIQQLRLFGPGGEFLVWRSDGGFAGRIIGAAADADEENSFTETHLLWGERTAPSQDGFTLLRAGARELLHAPPGAGQTAAVTVRHYIRYDQVGQAYVALSRLVDLTWTQEEA